MPEAINLPVGHDDVVVYKCDATLTQTALDGVAEMLSQAFPKNLVIVLNAGEDLRAMNDQQLASIGLMRKPPRGT